MSGVGAGRLVASSTRSSSVGEDIVATLDYVATASRTGLDVASGSRSRPVEAGRIGPYQILGPIGEGSIGRVFLASDTRLSRQVALKVLRPEWAGDPEARERFLREARAAAAVRHDHVVTVYEVGEEDEIQYLAMERLRGLSLQDWLDRGQDLTARALLRIGREIASGLDAAHRGGLVHRDVKPANIWLEAPAARVKLLDFGLARFDRDDSQLSLAGALVGTPAYMAPEQVRGEPATVASDLFSLGGVLYQLCAGRPPFEGASTFAVLSAITTGTPPPPRSIRPDIPPALDELVMRLLARDPADRPASALAVVEALRAIEREKPGSTATSPLRTAGEDAEAPTGSLAEGGNGRRHTRRLAGLVMLSITVLLLFASSRGDRLARSFEVSSMSGQAPGLLAAGNKDGAPLPPCADPHEVDAGEAHSGAAITPERAQSVATVQDGAARLDQAAADHRNSATASGARPVVADEAPKAVSPQGIPSPAESSAAVAIATDLTPNPGAWSRPVDPDGDTAIELDDTSGEIKFAIPGTPHVLGAEIGRMNAPRVLRPVRGDFAAGVVVNGVFHPGGRATIREYAAYHGAGLLLWQDERNYLRLEIAADVRHGRPRPYANFELRRGGALVVSQGIEIKDGSSRLLLVRRGGLVRAAFGRDGLHWTWFTAVELGFDGPITVGGLAINSSSKPLLADLQSLRVVPIGDSGEAGAIREASGFPEVPVPVSRPEATKPTPLSQTQTGEQR